MACIGESQWDFPSERLVALAAGQGTALLTSRRRAPRRAEHRRGVGGTEVVHRRLAEAVRRGRRLRQGEGPRRGAVRYIGAVAVPPGAALLALAGAGARRHLEAGLAQTLRERGAPLRLGHLPQRARHAPSMQHNTPRLRAERSVGEAL